MPQLKMTLFKLVDIGLRTTGSDCTLLVASTAGARISLSHHIVTSPKDNYHILHLL